MRVSWRSGRPILDGQAGEAGAAAEIEELLLGVARAEVAGGEERLAEMALDHSLGCAQGGEVHALVPADEQREVDGDGIEQKRRRVRREGRRVRAESRRAAASMVNRINAAARGKFGAKCSCMERG